MLMQLPIIILASLHPVSDAVPKFDIARECQFEVGSNGTQNSCAADEAQARNRLQEEWSQFPPGVRSQCAQESGMDGIASYVELLTCLEMETEVRLERKANKPMR